MKLEELLSKYEDSRYDLSCFKRRYSLRWTVKLWWCMHSVYAKWILIWIWRCIICICTINKKAQVFGKIHWYRGPSKSQLQCHIFAPEEYGNYGKAAKYCSEFTFSSQVNIFDGASVTRMSNITFVLSYHGVSRLRPIEAFKHHDNSLEITRHFNVTCPKVYFFRPKLSSNASYRFGQPYIDQGPSSRKNLILFGVYES